MAAVHPTADPGDEPDVEPLDAGDAPGPAPDGAGPALDEPGGAPPVRPVTRSGPTPSRPRPADGTIWAPGTAPGAWVATPKRPRLDTRPRQEPVGVGRAGAIVNLEGLTNVLLFAYGATFAVLTAFAAALARRRNAVTAAVGAEERTRALDHSSGLVEATVVGLVLIASGVLLVNAAWCWVAAKNQQELAGEPTIPSPWGALLGWFVPIANLLLPFRTVAALMEGPDGDDPVTVSVSRWWLSWLATAGFTGAGAWQMRTFTGERNSLSLSVPASGVLFAALGAACCLYCFSQARDVFRTIARHQHDRAYGIPPAA